MKKGFTLVEVLAIIVILGILAVIIAPVVQKGLNSNYDDVLEIQKKNIIKAAKDWSLEHPGRLPVNSGDVATISLGELKKGYLDLDVKNPKSNKIWVDSSYVLVTNDNGNYTYKITNDTLYELDECITSNVFPILFTEKCVNNELSVSDLVVVGTPSELNYPLYDSQVTYQQDYLMQYLLNGNEVSGINADEEKIYTVVYTALENKGKTNENCLKAVQTVTINNQCGNGE